MEGRADLSCSFCGRSQSAVRILVNGPAGNICDQCVEICDSLVHEQLEPSVEAPRSPLESTFVCRLCGLESVATRGTVIPGRGALCGPCFDAVLAASERKGETGERLDAS